MLTNNTFVGRALRLPLRLIPKDATVRAIGGLTRGMKWRVGSSVHGCWLGTYESKKQRAIREVVRPEMNVWDVGANVGYYALGFCALGARVWAFEPEPRNLIDLRRHIDINCVNAQIVDAAVSDHVGTANFSGHGATGRISDTGRIVRAVTLDSLSFPHPHVVKIDIEGGELAALRGAAQLIAERRTTWLVALDDPANNEACRALFPGYDVIDIGSQDEIMARPRKSAA